MTIRLTTVQIRWALSEYVGILGGGGFTLPVVSEVEVVDVSIDMTDAARSALSASMGGDEDY